MQLDSSWFVFSYMALWIFVAVSIFLWVAILRQIGLLHTRLGPTGALQSEDGPELGTKLPVDNFVALDGSHGILHQSKPTLVGMVQPGCSVCDSILPAFRKMSRQPHPHTGVLLVIEAPDRATAETYVASKGLSAQHVVTVKDLGKSLNVSSTPFAVLVDTTGVVLSKGLINSMEHVESLILGAGLDGDLPVIRDKDDEPPQNDERFGSVVVDGRVSG